MSTMTKDVKNNKEWFRNNRKW